MRLKPAALSWRRLLIGGGLVLLLCLVAMIISVALNSGQPGGVVGLEVTQIQPGDGIRIDQSTENVSATISSEKGIGQIDLARQGSPPRSLTLTFELKGLEEMSLTWGDALVTVHVSSTDGTVRQDLALQGGEAIPIGDASPYWMPLRVDAETPGKIPLESGYFVINAPKAFLEEAPEHFSLKWIDFYR